METRHEFTGLFVAHVSDNGGGSSSPDTFVEAERLAAVLFSSVHDAEEALVLVGTNAAAAMEEVNLALLEALDHGSPQLLDLEYNLLETSSSGVHVLLGSQNGGIAGLLGNVHNIKAMLKQASHSDTAVIVCLLSRQKAVLGGQKHAGVFGILAVELLLIVRLALCKPLLITSTISGLVQFSTLLRAVLLDQTATQAISHGADFVEVSNTLVDSIVVEEVVFADLHQTVE